MNRVYLLVVALFVIVHGSRLEKQPNIVIILADDMGSNDVSYRGSNQFTTGNIDALGFNGVILDRHYTEAVCTPSRAALLTGQNPSKLGMQGIPLSAGEDRHLPNNIDTLPSLLKKLGYDTHLVGKWHLGSARREDTPTRRGFDTHFGYWNGYVGYFTYEVNSSVFQNNITKNLRGFDLREGFTDAWGSQGTYATELFTEKALEVIEKQDKNNPMFLLLAHLAVHTGDNDSVEVEDEKAMNDTFGYIQDIERRKYVDALMQMDKSVGRVMQKLQEQKMLNNTIVIFMSDNGAQVNLMYHNGGSNYPLRGEKFSLHEGGIRNAAIVYSPLLKTRNYIYEHPIHITDWLPTLYSIAGGDTATLKNVDGVNQWENLSGNLPNDREDFLVNIDEAMSYSAVIGNEGRYKLINGTILNGSYDSFGSEPDVGKTLTYNISAVMDSAVNTAIKSSNSLGNPLTPTTIEELRKNASAVRRNTKCLNKEKRSHVEVCSNFCLFDLILDPCETENLFDDLSKKDISEKLMAKLDEFWKKMVPQSNQPVDIDSDPAKYNGTWCTWKDDELCVKTSLESNLYA